MKYVPSGQVSRWRKPFGRFDNNRAIVAYCLLISGGIAVGAGLPGVDDAPDAGAQAGMVAANNAMEAVVVETSADDRALSSDIPEPAMEGDDPIEPRNNPDNTNAATSLLDDVVSEFYGHVSIKTRDDSFVGPPVPEDIDEHESDVETPKPPVAANIDLSDPVAPLLDVNGIDIGSIAPPVEPALRVYEQKSLLMLGAEVAPSTSTRLAWSPDQSFDGIAVPTPVLVVNGAKAGPTLCITAAIHGDELNGIEVVRRVLYDLDPEKLSGAVIGVPIVNLQGFRRASRYLPDRRDLNRYFPGNPNGSAASRLAYSFFTEVISHCDALVDLHTGSFQRTNLPQLRADLNNPQIVELTHGFGSTVVLHGAGTKGTLRRAASDAGIPTVTLEAGEPSRVQNEDVTHSTKGVMTLLNQLDMYDRTTNWGSREPVYYRSRWVRAESGGVLFSKVKLGDRVRKGELLGTVTDPITNVKSELRASAKGRVLGMALDQFVMPGFAAFRIGFERPESEVSAPTPIDVSDNSSGPENLDSDEDSQAIADFDAESYDEFEDESEYMDVRDNLEDSE